MATIAGVQPGIENIDMAVGRRKRMAAVVCAGFCSFLVLYAPQPLLPMLADSFRVSVAAISLVITVSTLAVAATAPLAGILADRWGCKRIIVPAAFLLAVPTLLAATSAGLGTLLFWRFWQGIFTPGIFVVTVAYINDEWEEGVGAAMAAYVTGTVLGGFCGRTLSALVAAHSSWHGAFVLLAAITLAGGLMIRAWLPHGRRSTRRARFSLRPTVGHLRNSHLLATYIVGFCLLFSLLGTFTYVNFYLAAPPFRLSTSALGLLYVVYLVGAAITPGAGRWIDRLGHRFTLATALTGAIAGILLTLVRSLPVVMVGLALVCTGGFVAQSAASSYIGVVAREARAAAVGLYVLFYYVGGSFGAGIPGHFWNFGGWPLCVTLIAAVQVLTISVTMLFWKPGPVHAAVEIAPPMGD
ncbi:MAG TPA: MFS transporter [Bryobacteraceae bacterium]|nr:MFS transporter [Bryobacteraceae bacterium]